MTNWEWFAPALTFLTAMLLWIANRYREDRLRFSAEKRAVYADFIRVQRDLKSHARDLIEITAQLEAKGPGPDRELQERARRLL